MFDHKYKVSDRGALDDLTSFNIEVPKPDALVDIEVALKEYNLDLANITFIYRNDAEQSLETNWRVLLNHRDWSLFWSKRHPSEGQRSREARELYQLEKSIQRIAAKARSVLDRRLRA
jgi:hypothetical protein